MKSTRTKDDLEKLVREWEAWGADAAHVLEQFRREHGSTAAAALLKACPLPVFQGDPVVKHMSVRLQAIHRPDQVKWERPKGLGIALLFCLDLGGKGRPEDMREYGHAVTIRREKLDEIFKGEELFIYEKGMDDGSLKEEGGIPCGHL